MDDVLKGSRYGAQSVLPILMILVQVTSIKVVGKFADVIELWVAFVVYVLAQKHTAWTDMGK
jgi:hypothetical protein